MAIGEQSSDELAQLATDALVRGLDSPAPREAAGASSSDPRDAADLFRAALDELGIPVPDVQEALRALAQNAAAAIIAGERAPLEGASWIWSAIYHRIDAEGDLRAFVGLASEWEDYPRGRSELEAAIVDESRELLNRDHPRRWLKVRAVADGSGLVEPRTQKRVEPAGLRLTEDLRSRVATWPKGYEAMLHRGGFDSAEDATDFVHVGRRLVELVQDELGPTWHVEYMPEPVAPPGLRLARPT